MSDTLSRRPPVRILWGNLSWHPAVAAWRQLDGNGPGPECVEVLREGKKSATYRLAGVGPNGSGVIAQRALAQKAAPERTVYERILPHVPVTAPRYYGVREEPRGTGFTWLFFEDVGDDRYSDTDTEHRALAARWVAQLHTGATRVAAARELPEGGPPRYLHYLRASRELLGTLSNPALAAEDVATLCELVADLRRLERRWSWLETACAGVPATVVHGDLQRKNTYIRHGPAGPELYAIDWETAGWGVPAADLTRIDLSTYWAAVRPAWPAVQFEHVRRLAAVGRMLLQLVAIHWVSPELRYDSPLYLRRPMSWVRAYQQRLAEAVRQLEEETA